MAARGIFLCWRNFSWLEKFSFGPHAVLRRTAREYLYFLSRSLHKLVFETFGRLELLAIKHKKKSSKAWELQNTESWPAATSAVHKHALRLYVTE